MRHLAVKPTMWTGIQPNSWGVRSEREKKKKKSNRELPRAAASFGKLIRQDNGQGFRIRDEVIIIGREYNCDIIIDEPNVSRVHAVICHENGSMVLEDLGGKNGTRINRTVVVRKILSDGDRIHIGRSVLVFKSKF
jgi:pSer/pThr/pTyr-binding forkhead associated (FHA) protein